MERQLKKITKVVRVLRDPHPEFVSIVERGANQIPFKSVKIDQTDATNTMKTRATKVTKVSPSIAEIHKVVFSGEKWKDEAQVRTYMEKEGYTNFEVEKVDDTFVIEAIAEENFELVQPVVKEDEGVTMFVGKLTEEAQAKLKKLDITIKIRDVRKPGQEEHEISVPGTKGEGEGEGEGETAGEGETTTDEGKAGEGEAANVRSRKRSDTFFPIKDKTINARKIDSYAAYYSNESTIAEVLKDAEDGLPVGFCDIESAFLGALKNVIKTGQIDQISTLMTEYGTLITKLASLTASVEKSEERDAAIEKLFASVATKGLEHGEQLQAVEGHFEGIEAVIAKALEPVVAALKSLATKSDLKPVTDQVDKMAARVLRDSAIHSVPKGATTEEVVTTEPTTTKANGEQSETPSRLKKAESNLFGFRFREPAVKTEKA